MNDPGDDDSDVDPTTGQALVVMQPRCLFCDATHYGPSVWDISHGRADCGTCGRTQPVFRSERVYREQRRLYRRNEG